MAEITLASAHQMGDISLMTPSETAEALRISARTLERWRTQGRGPNTVRNRPATHRLQGRRRAGIRRRRSSLVKSPVSNRANTLENKMANSINGHAGKAWPSTEFDPNSNTAIIRLDYNGLCSPLEIVPRDWATIVYVPNIEPHDVPGPHRYEGAPLRQAIQTAKHIYISLHTADGSTAQLGQQDMLLTLAEIWNVTRRGENVLLIQTLWTWLAPWESVVRSEALPGVSVTILDHTGPRALHFEAKPARKARRRRRRDVGARK